ncbi:hypothetical protein COOONC_15262, partial [Cooperia oncophora]
MADNRSGTTSPEKNWLKEVIEIRYKEVEVKTIDKSEEICTSHLHGKQILPRCAYLWDVMEQEKETLHLGLFLFSTQFGYMISGRQRGFESPISVLHLDEISSEANEYTGSENIEKQRTNEEVAKRLKEIIENRADGYHVHLTWKENAKLPPTNKSIAFKTAVFAPFEQ